MVEFKIQLEESFAQSLGYNEIDKQLPELIQRIILKYKRKNWWYWKFNGKTKLCFQRDF